MFSITPHREVTMLIKKILIADDSPSDRHALLEELSQHACRSVSAESGAEALAKSKAATPDLSLTDIIMPAINGYEATRAITRDTETRGIPVFLCTGKGQETDRLWGMRQGARDYVPKPVDF